MKNEQLAYATDYAGECTSTEGLYQTLKHIADAGISHIHWCHEWDGDYVYSIYEMLQIKGWMNDLGLKCKGVHATEGCRKINIVGKFYPRYHEQNRRDYTSENEFNRMAGVELIRNRIEMASILGTDAIVLHMQLPYKEFEKNVDCKELYYRQAFKSLDELEHDCMEKGVRICIENMPGTPDNYQVEQFDRLFDRYDSAFLGFCFDAGHGLITGGENPLYLLERYQDRLYMMHLHDNHGLISEECWEQGDLMVKCDEHTNPFCGNMDWEKAAQIIAGSPYELPIVLELAKRDADEQLFLEESLNAGKRITEMILKYRDK